MSIIRITVIGAFVSFLLASCHGGKKQEEVQTLYSGNITIAVDETLKPIMEEELQVYRALTPEAVVTPIYCNEVEAVNLLMKDSVRLAITNRRLTEKEISSFHSRKFFPESVAMAVSGLALIVHKDNPDSLITVSQLRDILSGKITSWGSLSSGKGKGDIQVVFDNPNSGTVHYAIDSICKGKPMGENVKALATNEEVIRYVSSARGALGIISANWVGNDADTTRLSFNESVCVMAVSDGHEAASYNSYKPYQAYLALRKYPLTNEVYILINDPAGALPTGLMTFLTSDRGQRIILKSGLVPATQPVRLVNVKED